MGRTKKQMKKSTRIILIILAIIGIVFAVMGIKWAVKSQRINDDYSAAIVSDRFQEPVSVQGVDPITQEVTCGYAVIEMLSNWAGKDITEESLLADNDGKITTAMGNGFEKETSKQFPEYTVDKYENLSNTEMLEKIHDSLANGFPVPIEFAALFEDEDERLWTMHFALVTALDIPNDSVEVVNPYGYTEIYSVDDFLKAMRYESYEDMPFYLKLGFLAELFTRNTIHIIS